MTDLKRLIDEVDSDFARSVLRSGRSLAPSPNRQKQVLAALGVGAVIATTHKVSWAAVSTWQKVALLGGVACVGAGGALTYGYLAEPASHSGRDVPVVEAPRSESEAEPAIPVTATEPADDPVVPAGEPVAVRSRVSERAVPASQKAAEVSTVKAELELLEQARGSLDSGNANAALQTLRRYAERHPRGSMRLEAEVLRVEALAASGRSSEAARLAERLLSRNPKSVVAARLRRFTSKE
jgi:hypothetical protein